MTNHNEAEERSMTRNTEALRDVMGQAVNFIATTPPQPSNTEGQG